MAETETQKIYYEIGRFVHFIQELKKLGLEPNKIAPIILQEDDFALLPDFLQKLPSGYMFTSIEVHYLKEITLNLAGPNKTTAKMSCKIIHGELRPHVEVTSDEDVAFFEGRKIYTLQTLSKPQAFVLDHIEANQIVNAVVAILKNRFASKKSASV